MTNKKLPDWKILKCECIRLRLDGLDVFNILSDEAIEKTFNYIGPDRMPEKIRIYLSKIFDCVLPAVLIHDCRFVIGGTIRDFHSANTELRKNLVKCLRANRKEFTLVGYWLARIKIQIAYLLCEKYGKEGWKFKNETV